MRARGHWQGRMGIIAANAIVLTLVGLGSGRAALAAPKPLVVEAGQSVDRVAAKDRTVDIEGSVREDVVTVNSAVHIGAGAAVGGSVIAFGGSVTVDPTVRGVQVVHASAASASALDAAFGSTRHAADNKQRHNWVSMQIFLLALGLLVGLIVLVVAGGVAENVASTLVAQPGRSLVYGIVGGATSFLLLAINDGIAKSSPVMGALSSPISGMVAIGILLVAAFSWQCAMRVVGNAAARRLHRSGDSTLWRRMALGLLVFFAVNTIAGIANIGLGVLCMSAEVFVTVMAIGALLIRLQALWRDRAGRPVGPPRSSPAPGT